VCGLQSDAIQKALLSKADLTLESALQVAQSMEAAAQKTKDIKGANRSASVMTVSTPSGKAGACGRCGRGNHVSSECRFKSAKCHKCGKIGHIAPVCRSKRTQKPPKKPPHSTNYTTVQSEDNEPNEPIFVVGSSSLSSHPYVVTLQVNGCPLAMEVDTGAAVSLAPESALSSILSSAPLRTSNVVLKTYMGEKIPVKGVLSVSVGYGDQLHQNMELLVVQGSGPCLMGRDWLKIIRLDWKAIGQISSTNEEFLSSLKVKYESVFEETLGTVTPMKAALHVREGARPKFFKPRPLPYALREQVEQELDRLESEGVLEKTCYSEWAAPIVAVPKRDGRIRLCGDYKVTINPVLDVDQYPLPRPEDIFASLTGGQKFTTLDLSHAYNQLLLEEESRKYVTINTHRGLYQYTRLPFGIASAPAIFQRTMDTILQGVDGIGCYIDDIIITGKTTKEHFEHLEEVLRRLQLHGLRVKFSKCRFLKPSVDFLGHVVDSEGIHAAQNKLTAIVQAPSPSNIQELRSFLGLLNYYGKFISNLSTLLHPLNALLRKDSKWRWTKECQQSFETAKEKLVSSQVLVHYNPELQIKLAGDASAYGVGAVISHVLEDGTEHPVAFASRTLTSSERNYAQVEKEALALIFGVKRFHTYLYGRSFTIVTDHKPLTTILGPKTGIPTLAAARLQRWAWILSAYKYKIEFRPTGKHGNADGLSRLPLKEMPCQDQLSETEIFNISQMEALPVTVQQL